MSATKPTPALFKRNPPIVGEAEAIESAKNGDAEAFSKLYALHKRRVYTLCLRMLGNVSEAEDMTQEAFLHLFRKIGSFRGESAFSTWLYRVVYNHCLNAIAKKKRLIGKSEEILIEPPDPRTLPARKEGRAQRALDQLSEGDRTLLVMKYITELEIEEISRILNLGVSAVKMRLLRARELFKNKYRELL